MMISNVFVERNNSKNRYFSMSDPEVDKDTEQVSIGKFL